MNKNKGFRRPIAILSALLLALGILGTIVDLDRIWVIWGVICSASMWIIYGLILYIIKGFTDTSSLEDSQSSPAINAKTGQMLRGLKPVIKPFIWLAHKPLQAMSRVTMPKWFITLIFTLVIIVAAFYACTHMVGAGDTWVSLASGRYYSNHGVTTTDPFSFNSYKAGPTEENVKTWPDWVQGVTKILGINTVRFWHPTGWVNHNWFVDMFFYRLTEKSLIADADSLSFNSLVYLKFAIYLLTAFIIFRAIRILDIHPFTAIIFTCAAMVVSRSFLTIRAYDFANLLSAVLILILILTTYRNILFIWLIVPLLVLWANIYSSYIFALAILGVFLITNILSLVSSKLFNSVGFRGIVHILSAGILVVIGIVIFNPYHLSNITYAFSKFFGNLSTVWITINQWHPAFEKNNPVGDSFPFALMLICASAIVLFWIVVSEIAVPVFIKVLDHHRKKQLTEQQMENTDVALPAVSPNGSKQEVMDNSPVFQWPKIELSLIAATGLTVCIALRYRSFIPMSAIFVCPIAALLLTQVIRSVSLAFNFKRKNVFEASSVPHSMEVLSVYITIIAVLGFGFYCGFRFKKVYLDPWPNNRTLNSVFMRMTASDAKPFAACQFIRDNKVEGKIFNYWTEGGFIAYNQNPNPDTGKIPLQLYIDGRAAEVYDFEAYEQWFNIMSGGPTAYKANVQEKALNTQDYIEIGNYIDTNLKERNVWIVLVPSGQFDSYLVKGLVTNPNWWPVYMDDQQKLIVDVNSDQGKLLYTGMFSGTTKFPDDFSKRLTVGYNLLKMKDKENVENGCNMLIEAFKQRPCYVSAVELINNIAVSHPQLKDKIAEVFGRYLDDFEKNKIAYVKQHGYYDKITSAMLAANYLKQVNINNSELSEKYETRLKTYRDERNEIVENSRW